MTKTSGFIQGWGLEEHTTNFLTSGFIQKGGANTDDKNCINILNTDYGTV